MARHPNAERLHNPSSSNTRELLKRIGRPYSEIASVLGCSKRTIERYAAEGGCIPYPEQFMLEELAEIADRRKRARASAHPLQGLSIT